MPHVNNDISSVCNTAVDHYHNKGFDSFTKVLTWFLFHRSEKQDGLFRYSTFMRHGRYLAISRQKPGKRTTSIHAFVLQITSATQEASVPFNYDFTTGYRSNPFNPALLNASYESLRGAHRPSATRRPTADVTHGYHSRDDSNQSSSRTHCPSPASRPADNVTRDPSVRPQAYTAP